MGYSTQFSGSFNINKPVDEETFNLLKGLSETRRMKRNVDAKYGVEGEFYIADEKTGVTDGNSPPSTQPGLWCQWEIQEDRQTIEWDEGEKFYSYVEWIEYLIGKVLAPKGYKLNGLVLFQGEDVSDNGGIKIVDNIVNGKAVTSDDKVLQLLDENSKLKEDLKTKKAQEGKAEEVKQLLKDGTLKRMMAATNFQGTLDEYKETMKILLG